MIISKRDEGMAVACQGLTGNLVIFSWMLGGGWETVFNSMLMENIVRGNKGERGTETRTGGIENEKMGWWQQFSIQHEEKDWDRGLRKEQDRQLTMNQGWEESREWIFAILLVCCSVFFCWHRKHGGNTQWFFIGHMPLQNDLWMQAFCRLILLSTHYVAQPSMAI